MPETYKICVQCRNCRHIPLTDAIPDSTEHTVYEKFPIPRGSSVKDFLQEMECKNCGCTGYMGLL